MLRYDESASGQTIYAYVGGHPTGLIDSSGLSPSCNVYYTNPRRTIAITSEKVLDGITNQINLGFPKFHADPSLHLSSNPRRTLRLEPSVVFEIDEVEISWWTEKKYRLETLVQDRTTICTEDYVTACGKIQHHNYINHDSDVQVLSKELIGVRPYTTRRVIRVLGELSWPPF